MQATRSSGCADTITTLSRDFFASADADAILDTPATAAAPNTNSLLFILLSHYVQWTSGETFHPLSVPHIIPPMLKPLEFNPNFRIANANFANHFPFLPRQSIMAYGLPLDGMAFVMPSSRIHPAKRYAPQPCHRQHHEGLLHWCSPFPITPLSRDMRLEKAAPYGYRQHQAALANSPSSQPSRRQHQPPGRLQSTRETA